MTRTLWIDASVGASGDMLLGALVGAGVPLDVLQAAVDDVAPEPVVLRAEEVTRNGLAATRVHVQTTESHHHRTWRDVRALLGGHDRARAAFERLAVAEGAVHGTDPEDVHFHEVGALDAITDVVGVSAGLDHLGPSAVVVSPVAVGSGTVRAAHGILPVPPPAVVELLRGAPSYAGPAAFEACTPTGAALLSSVATGWGPQPMMTTEAVGIGAGGHDPATHANVLRLLVGTTEGATADELVLEANVDDLDPRLWPRVLDALLAAGAADAWLTQILMKKGRPAHTLGVLVAPTHAAAVRQVVFRHTTTIGLREHAVTKRALAREIVEVPVAGQVVAVKVARLEGRVVNAQPEYDDVARAAAALGRPERDVMDEARAAFERTH